jgi:stalled ribosome rescue protein Dom34
MTKHQNNKNQIGVWIDGHKALIVKFSEGALKVGVLESNMEDAYYHEGESIKGNFSGSQHDNREKTISERKQNISRKFKKNVFEEIQDADEIYITGPGEMRTRLAHFIEEEHKHFADKIKAVESCDYLSELQIIKRMKEFFHLK